MLFTDLSKQFVQISRGSHDRGGSTFTRSCMLQYIRIKNAENGRAGF